MQHGGFSWHSWEVRSGQGSMPKPARTLRAKGTGVHYTDFPPRVKEVVRRNSAERRGEGLEIASGKGVGFSRESASGEVER